MVFFIEGPGYSAMAKKRNVAESTLVAMPGAEENQ